MMIVIGVSTRLDDYANNCVKDNGLSKIFKDCFLCLLDVILYSELVLFIEHQHGFLVISNSTARTFRVLRGIYFARWRGFAST